MIDEADRMMEQVKQEWLTQVEGAVYCSGRERRGGGGGLIINNYIIIV